MASSSRQKIYVYAVEIGKWGLLLYLLLPLKGALQGSVDFARVAAGIGLFVIFAGKLLYDVVFFPRQHERESNPRKDLITMIAIVVGIASLVLLVVFFVAVYLINYLSSSAKTF